MLDGKLVDGNANEGSFDYEIRLLVNIPGVNYLSLIPDAAKTD
jgi:hypothetical protein